MEELTAESIQGGSIQGKDLNITSSNAVVSTIAGSAGVSGSTDGAGTAARFYGTLFINTQLKT